MDKIENIAKKVCEEEKIEFLKLETRKENKDLVICIYINKEGGIKVDDCALINRRLNRLIDIETNLKSYRLEVSSPGI